MRVETMDGNPEDSVALTREGDSTGTVRIVSVFVWRAVHLSPEANGEATLILFKSSKGNPPER